MKAYFFDLVSQIQLTIGADFFFTAFLSGEESDFIRFNSGKIVQAGSVSQNLLSLDVIKNKRHSTISLMLSGSLNEDLKAVRSLLDNAKRDIAYLEDDPFLLFSTKVTNSDQMAEASLPPASEIVNKIVNAAQGLDFVGIHAQGKIRRGFANSLGQKNFIEQQTFNTDFSVYHASDKAIKANLAGRIFDESQLYARLDTIRSRLPILKKTAKTISKGNYRAYLAPAAVDEVMGLLKYGGFSEKQVRTKQSPFLLLHQKERELDKRIKLFENTSNGFSTPFQSGGFIKPDCVRLVDEGKWGQGLVSPRTAQEYEIPTNAANASESPESLEMSGGDLEQDEILQRLGTGLLINNLWYLNYSDRLKAKITGMTRFATFWVENGEIIAPVNVMRFDDSIYRILGSSLEAISKEREFILDQSTYEERSFGSKHLPGILLSEITFTL